MATDGLMMMVGAVCSMMGGKEEEGTWKVTRTVVQVADERKGGMAR